MIPKRKVKARLKAISKYDAKPFAGFSKHHTLHCEVDKCCSLDNSLMSLEVTFYKQTGFL